MVRETRFSFDQNSARQFDPSPEDFTEEDDLFLDAFSPPTARDKSGKTRRKRGCPKKQRNPRPSASSSSSSSQAKKSKDDDRRGHLADADWLNPPKSSGRKSSRKSA